MTKQKIISFAKKLKEEFKTRDPFEIAKKLEIDIDYTSLNKKVMPGYIIRPFEDKPPKIMINSGFDTKSRKVICAHELGHATLHKSARNQFDGNSTNGSEEFEANLFAVALLFNEEDFNMKLESMDNYVLKGILNHNITY